MSESPQPIEKQTTIYKCPFCVKWGRAKHAMVKHIRFCSGNPEGLNRALCQDCKHCVRGSEEIDIGGDYYTGEPITKPVTTYSCSIKGIGLYPPIALRRGLVERYPWSFQDKELMPIKCTQYESVHE